ncbi:MAG TPA: nickel pincer cofactor biosynthesis protein LarC [Candidatus Acidoferrum sp.]|nr:nickel pincer cofactor biosynthesis protein LarC [Candidatus Acidoferrum sp.]
MKTLYLDIFSGISGDMVLGALLDLGVDARKLERELKKLKLDGYHLHVTRQLKSGIEGVKLDVHLTDQRHRRIHDRIPHEHGGGETAGGFSIHEPGHHAHHDPNRTFREIQQLITKSTLSPWVKKRSVAVFRRIAEAEGKIHGLPAERVHFHEVGAVDSIVDIVGACIALERLGKPRVLAAPVVEGTGWVNCAHGRFPVPAPATLAILGARGIGLTQCDEPHELVTPTGAALLAEFVESFGPMQNLAAEKIGFGLGTRENRARPNVLRAVLGKESKAPNPKAKVLDWETDRVAVLETNLDDVSPEVLGYFMETALAAGALDVFHTPIQMKKSRPGVLLTILCAEGDAERFSELILRETSAFGVRRTVAERRKLRREFARVETPWGEAVVKIGRLNGRIVQAAPEYESCKRLATRAKIPLKQVQETVLRGIKTNRAH